MLGGYRVLAGIAKSKRIPKRIVPKRGTDSLLWHHRQLRATRKKSAHHTSQTLTLGLCLKHILVRWVLQTLLLWQGLCSKDSEAKDLSSEQGS